MSKQKKILPLFLSIMILFSILAVADVSSFAVADDIDVIYEEESTDFEEDFFEPEYDNKYGYLTYEVIADEVIITDCDDTAEGEIIVPETIEGHPVTAIGESAFTYCYYITDVVLPYGITEIGARAFEHCNLRNIVLPDSIKEIGAEAFSSCGLESVNIPESVTTLRELVFSSCNKLTEVIVPDNITDVEMGVFSNCMGLEKVILPDSLTKISNGMFNACFNLKEVTIPDTVTEIGYLAFYQCYSLESIVIPESVEKLGAMAFGDIPNLKDIYVYNPDINLVGDSYVGIIEELDGIYNVTSVPEGFTLEEYVDLYLEYVSMAVKLFGAFDADNYEEYREQYRELIEKWEDIWTHEFHDVRTDLTIHGYDESTAHDFADKNGINFVAFESEEENPDDSQQDNAEDNTCSRCGEVHSNEIEELFCTIKSFFAKIIDFLKSLFV